MSKKHRNDKEEAKAQPQPFQPPPPPPAREEEDVPASKIWVFWGAVALAVITARVLDHFLINVHESVIERWIMGAFALFLIVFLKFL